MGLGEFFTNNEKTKEGEVDVATPAFSITKVMSGFGLAITAALGAVPASVKEEPAVVVAAIAAGAAIMLGVFALIAADIRTRQKAREATLRFGDGKPSEAKFQALPTKDLVLQVGHNSDEYEVKYATVENGVVNVYADRDGAPISVAFKEAPKPK